VHAVDVMPTLLELIGLEVPTVVRGVPQTPVEGVSFAHTFAEAEAPSRHITQYYEMLGSRAMYHDGWKAVVFHPLPMITYTERDDPNRSFEDDDWELYHVAEDFSETRDLAGERADKLRELVDLWWSEAERYNVLPVTNQPVRGADSRYRRDRFLFHPGIGSLPQLVAPNLSNRAWRMQAQLVVPESVAGGVLVCHGGHAGGYVAYVRDGRLHFGYNHLGSSLTTVSAEVALPTGPVVARIEFTPTGAFAGDVDLFYGDVPVGQGHLPRTTLVTFGVHGFTVGYQNGTPVSPLYAGRNEFTDGALAQVVIETDKRVRPGVPAGSEDRLGMATQ
jgi:arylsulfatase